MDLTVPLLSSFAPEASRVVAKLELGRRDGWKSLGEGHGRELSVSTASLQGIVRLQGLRSVLHYVSDPRALISFMHTVFQWPHYSLPPLFSPCIINHIPCPITASLISHIPPRRAPEIWLPGCGSG